MAEDKKKRPASPKAPRRSSNSRPPAKSKGGRPQGKGRSGGGGGRRHGGGGRSQNRGGKKPAPAQPNATFVVNPKDIKPPAADVLRVIVLGGCEEVGRNCTLLEYGSDIIMIDMGLQFPQEDMPGIDYIIPDMTYLRGKEKRIRGVIITHGHYDHIGGIPHVMPKIGNPPIYGLPITNAIIRKRQTDYRGNPKLNINDLKIDDTIKLGKFKVSFFHINHNIPDSVGILVETPTTRLVHTGDWKFDFHPVGEDRADFQKIALQGAKGIDVLMGDSTNASVPGHTVSEKVVGDELERIIEKAPGRLIIGTFASLLSRIKQIIELAEKHGKVVAVEGYSMKTNVEIAKEVGFLKCKANTLVPSGTIDKYPDNKVVVLCTGAQGEPNAALMRIANNEHRFVRVKEGDTVVFSSSVIPGNEGSVQRVYDTLYRRGAKVINYKMMDVHAGGHGRQEDIKLMISLFKPKFYVPIEGNHFMLKDNADIAYSLGYDKKDVFVVDNGQIMEFKGQKGVMRKEKVPTDYVFVDGLGVGDVSDIVLRDRNELASDGMIVVITQVETRSGKLIGAPDIISRGFVHMKENRDLIMGIKSEVTKSVSSKDPKSAADDDYIRRQIRNNVGKFVLQKTNRRPMILPVVISV